MTKENLKGIQEYVRKLKGAKTPERKLKVANDLNISIIRARRDQSPIRGTAREYAEPEIAEDKITLLIEELHKAEVSELKASLAFALGELAGESAVDGLTHLAGSEDDFRVRLAAVEALGKIGSLMVVKVLKNVAENDSHEIVRASACVALDKLDKAHQAHPEALEPITLGRKAMTLGGSVIGEFLKEISQNDGSGYVRHVAGNL